MLACDSWVHTEVHIICSEIIPCTENPGRTLNLFKFSVPLIDCSLESQANYIALQYYCTIG